MRKKITFLAFCLILLLIFTSLGYAKPDPKYERILGHPWNDPYLAPAGETTTVNVLMLSIGPNTILIFKMTRTISTTESTDQSNINREKWIKAPEEFPKRLPQR